MTTEVCSTNAKTGQRGSAGNLFKEILGDKGHMPGVTSTDLDSRTIDLVIGDNIPAHDFTEFALHEDLDSLPESISGGDDVTSDLGDPIHDDSLLEDLFYAQSESDKNSEDEIQRKKMTPRITEQDLPPIVRSASQVSLEDPGNMRPPSRKSSLGTITPPTHDYPPPSHVQPPSTNQQQSQSQQKKSGKAKRKKRSSNKSHRSTMSSDDDVMSQGSRVSFDMTSDIEESENKENDVHIDVVDGLSVERLTLLGRVHVARVHIDFLHLLQLPNLTLPGGKPTKAKLKGKPPRPSPKLSTKTCTYFVEYQFPVVATSRDKYTPNTMATEVMRVVSKKVNEDEISFNHRSVFPAMFNAASIEKWWTSVLVFKIFARPRGQKTPSLIGTCFMSLKSVLKAETLHLEKDLEVKVRLQGSSSRSRNSSSSSNGASKDIIGCLKVNIELASDSKDFSTQLARTRVAEMRGPKLVPILPCRKELPDFQAGPQPFNLQSINTETQASSLSSQTTQTDVRHVEINQAPEGVTGLYKQMTHFSSEEDAMTLHSLLIIPEGRGITLQGRPPVNTGHSLSTPPQPYNARMHDGRNTRNLYVVCRMFWCQDAISSNICWGTTEPTFNFMQVAPVQITRPLLDRMRNNFMVIEIWDKKTTGQNDELVGITKLSLHQFYMSFREEKIAKSLLRSQYPVVAADNYFPVMSPFNGAQYGQLRVLLAMGSEAQVGNLEQMKVPDGVLSLDRRPLQPQGYFERQDLRKESDTSPVVSSPLAGQTEHVFEVDITGLRGLDLFDSMVWGEADVFVQYHFPTQCKDPGSLHSSGLSLKPYRTSTTLCMPDPTFHDVTRHKIVLADGTPVQREILTACSGAGGGSGGIVFEVWCRFYHPNIRDQLIARTTLPLAKLCAMVTMQKRGEATVQTYALPLQAAFDDDDAEKIAKSSGSGLLDISINYKTNTVIPSSVGAQPYAPSIAATGNQQVCLTIGVLRASGLKTAGEKVARLDSGMQYVSEVGLNPYVKINLSFLTKTDERTTRTVARTFTPEFLQEMDFPCPLIWTDTDSDALSLAEILETGEVTLDVWHQVPSLGPDYIMEEGGSSVTGRAVVTKTSDVHLGKCRVSLKQLLASKTGLSGWFPIEATSSGWKNNQDADGVLLTRGLHRIVGGLELSIKFPHIQDRDRVINAARHVGWSPEDVSLGEFEDDADSDRLCKLTVSIDSLGFPVKNGLRLDQKDLDKDVKCYIRYKIYDRGAVCSRPSDVTIEGDFVTCTMGYHKTFHLNHTEPLSWYLREERLEVQIWLATNGKRDKKIIRPRNRDKLIGSAYMDMSSLSDKRWRKKHRISGVYPLFKSGCPSLGGAYVQAHVTLTPSIGEHDEADTLSSEASEEDPIYPPRRNTDPSYQPEHLPTSQPNPTKDFSEEGAGVDFEALEKGFKAKVLVERAMHLPTAPSKKSDSLEQPSTYVTYDTLQGVQNTSIAHGSSSPVYDDAKDVLLNKDLLVGNSKSAVFKVWHKPMGTTESPEKSTDSVLGFVSVDLRPLVAGLHQIYGWYNISDFMGQCKGQIQIGVMPLESIRHILPQGAPIDNHTSQYSTNASFLTTATYPTFPSHISRHTEQNISFISEKIPTSSEQKSGLSHFEEHRENVKRFHMSLHERLNGNPKDKLSWQPQFSEHDDHGSTSKSILLQNLRSNMAELDMINLRLKEKLASPLGTHSSKNQHQEYNVASHTTPPDTVYNENSTHLYSRDITTESDNHEVHIGHNLAHSSNKPRGLLTDDHSETNVDHFHERENPWRHNKDVPQQAEEFQLNNQDKQVHKYPSQEETGAQETEPRSGAKSDDFLSHTTKESFSIAGDIGSFDGTDFIDEQFKQYSGAFSDSGSDINDDDIVPIKPLNDVSSAFFMNSANNEIGEMNKHSDLRPLQADTSSLRDIPHMPANELDIDLTYPKTLEAPRYDRDSDKLPTNTEQTNYFTQHSNISEDSESNMGNNKEGFVNARHNVIQSYDTDSIGDKELRELTTARTFGAKIIDGNAKSTDRRLDYGLPNDGANHDEAEFNSSYIQTETMFDLDNSDTAIDSTKIDDDMKGNTHPKHDEEQSRSPDEFYDSTRNMTSDIDSKRLDSHRSRQDQQNEVKDKVSIEDLGSENEIEIWETYETNKSQQRQNQKTGNDFFTHSVKPHEEFIRSKSPVTRSRSPSPEMRYPETGPRSSETRTRSPEPRTRSPGSQARSPVTRTRSPETRTRSNETRTRSPESKTESAETRIRSPEMNSPCAKSMSHAVSPEIEPVESRSQSPETIAPCTRPKDDKLGAGDGSKENIARTKTLPSVPKFFIGAGALEKSMKALQASTHLYPNSSLTQKREESKLSEPQNAARDFAAKLTGHRFSTQNSKQQRSQNPTAEDAKRIAKIFSTKFS